MIALLRICGVIFLDAVFAILGCVSASAEVFRVAVIHPLYGREEKPELDPGLAGARLMDLRLAYPALPDPETKIEDRPTLWANWRS